MEITAEMHRAGLAAFEEWRAAPLGVGHGDVVSRILTAALDVVPAFPALTAPAELVPADPDGIDTFKTDPTPNTGAEQRELAAADAPTEADLGLVAQDGDASEPKADAEEDPPREPEVA